MRSTAYLLTLLLLTSFNADVSGPWIKTDGDNITLYSRPIDFSKTNSPDSIALQKIMIEQTQIIELINQQLKTQFNEHVEIYLYNQDEAKEKIGTNSGGYCSSRRPRIYFTFFDKPVFNTIRNANEYIGVHEMVHLVTNHELGKPKTSFFGEGYANAIDGNYGSVKAGDSLIRRRNDTSLQLLIEKGFFLTPHELLNNSKIPVRLFYPQTGCLVKWMFSEYGVEKINRLYTLNAKQIKKNFIKVTGDTFEEMEKKYLRYIEKKYDTRQKI